MREIARAAAQLPVAAQVVTADYHSRLGAAEQAALHSFDAAEPYRVVRLKCSGRLTPAGIVRLAAGLDQRRSQWRETAPVLLSVGAQMAAFLLQAAGRFPARRAICFFHGSELLRFARHPFWRPLARRFYARAAGFAVASQYVQDLAHQSGLLPANAAFCLAPCAVPATLTGPPSDFPAKTEGTIRILTVARLHPRKGQLQVAQALALLPAEMRARLVYRLVGTGDPAYQRSVEAVCRKAEVRCECLGDIDERALAMMYSRCTIYAQASQTLPQSVEGFGISLLEAGYYGCPIAAFRSGGVSEAVQDGRSGILVAEGDVADLSAAIARLIADPELRQQYGAAGREYALGFAWSRSARSLVDFALER